MLSDNPWIDGYLPQARTRKWTSEGISLPSRVSRVLSWIYAGPRTRSFLERMSRGVSYALYRVVRELRKPDAQARERMEFLSRAKYPYEVFQD